MSAARRLAVMAVAACAVACGRKGPPLAPLNLVPVAPANITVGRVGAEAQIRFNVPSTNVNGPGPVAVDRLEVFAATVAAGAVRPANRELLTPKYRVATIAIKPPPVEGEALPETAPGDTRPSAGERTTFTEQLTEDKLTPVFTTLPKAPASAGPTAPALPGAPVAAPAAPAAPDAAGVEPVAAPTVPSAPGATGVAPVAAPTVPAAPGAAGVAPVGTPAAPGATGVPPMQPAPEPALPGEPLPIPTAPGSTPAPSAQLIAPVPPTPPLPSYPARLYVVRGVTKKGRPGPPSTRVELPLVEPPAAPPLPAATSTENSIVITWSAPAFGTPIAYNIYKAGSADPINPAPMTDGKYERAGITFGAEECFTLRAVQKVAAVSLESTPSEQVCLTPRDTFPPAAPKGLSIVAGSGTMNLGWDANTEPDLAGYLVLRGEAAGGTLQPLTPAPITATSYEDKTVTPGVRYTYAIVAVDKATPPNRSAPSARIEETAR
jgi:hypothetical protein